VDQALSGGVDCVQLREKDLPGGELFRLARDLRAVTARAGVPLLINDRIDVALAVRAHGVQLGAGSIPMAEARRLLPPGMLIGYSAHSVEEAMGAALAGADFVVLAPVYEPGSKPAASSLPPLGPGTVWSASARLSIPAYALGGITATRASQLMNPPPGAGSPPAGVCAISALLATGDVASAAAGMRDALRLSGPTAG
jgi:thiamine-phosphate pyrophosphorylase